MNREYANPCEADRGSVRPLGRGELGAALPLRSRRGPASRHAVRGDRARGRARRPRPAARRLAGARCEALANLALERRRPPSCWCAGECTTAPSAACRTARLPPRGRPAARGPASRRWWSTATTTPCIDGWSAVRAAGRTACHVFGTGGVERRRVERDGELLAVVHGMSYAHRDTAENLARRFARTDDDALQIGLLHANVGGRRDARRLQPVHRRRPRARRASTTGRSATSTCTRCVHERAAVGSSTPARCRAAARTPASAARRAPASSRSRTVRWSAWSTSRSTACASRRRTWTIEGVADLAELEAVLAERGAAALAEADGRSVLLRAG